LLRTVSLFWDSMCILNHFSQQAAMAASANEGGQVQPLRFLESTHLTEKERVGYATFSEFIATVIFPYAFSQFWFYELYAMGVPLFLPSKATLPLYINQDYAVCPDFEGHRPGHSPLKVHPHSPFDRDDFEAMSYWSQYTDYHRFPHVTYFESIPELIMKLGKQDHRATSRKMLQAHQQHLGVATTFWLSALDQVALLSGATAAAATGSGTSAEEVEPESVELSDMMRDLSTRQLSGGTPARGDAYPRNANDGDTFQEHPHEYHALPESSRGGSHWWVQLRRIATDPEVKIWARSCCCGSYGNRLWLRLGNSTYMKDSIECASLDVTEGAVLSTVCSGVGE